MIENKFAGTNFMGITVLPGKEKNCAMFVDLCEHRLNGIGALGVVSWIDGDGVLESAAVIWDDTEPVAGVIDLIDEEDEIKVII